MMRMFNQPVDQELLESIEREEKFASMMFGESVKKEPEVQVTLVTPEKIVIEEEQTIVAEVAQVEPLPQQPEKPAETGIRPPEEVRVKQIANYISAVSKLPPESAAVGNKELEDVKKAIADLLKKVNTLSWGSGGGGVGHVSIGDADDFDNTTFGEGRTLRWINGKFRLDEHSSGASPWILKTYNYTAVDGDRIIGDTSEGSITITLPEFPNTGDEVTVMDGDDWSVNPITIARNGSTIEGIADDMTSNNKGIIIKLVYNGNPGVETWQVAATLGPRGPAGYGEVATTTVTTSSYTVGVNDWYIGVNYAGTVTVTLPATANTGRIISVKDESGSASTNPITLSGTVDNDAGGFIMQIDNGGVQLLYRNGWRVI